jgi:GntR family transcriptional regulator, histidine utilization repressor
MSALPVNSWRAVRAEILRRIKERIWQPGDLIPNEADLAAELGCARATVNRAMRAVAEAGYVDRKRKAGTRVSLNPVRKATLDIPVIRYEVEGRGAIWGYNLLEYMQCAPPGRISRLLKRDRALPLLYIASVHYADQKPFVYEERWLNPGAVPAAKSVDFQTISANEWLVRNAGFTHGDIALSAANASAAEAQILETTTGKALFVIDRKTWNGDSLITVVRLCYAPGFRMHTTI